jgi:2,5-dioxopentanoate dehydrogenase
MSHQLCGRHLINGRWVAAASAGRETFTAVDPATGAALAPAFAEATLGEVDAALSAARQAFSAVQEHYPYWPAELLEAIAAQIEALGDELLQRGEAETALPCARLTGERARTCAQLRMFAKIVRDGSWVDAVIDLGDPQRQPLPKPDLRRMLRPRGPVAVFGASNFPFAFGACGGDTASALAAGNPVIVKGHPSHPGTSELFAVAVSKAIDECHLPAGLFALLQGTRHELSAWLVNHPLTQAVGFTGSHRAGRALFDLASRRATPISVYAEMGSVNPVVILPAALRERAVEIAEGLSASLLMGGGQFCTKPGITFIVDDPEHTFVNALARNIQAAPQVTMLNRGLRDAFADRASAMSQASGVETVVVGKAAGHAGQTPALLVTTAEAFLREPLLHEEAFGPAGLVVQCDNAEEALACVESLAGNLTGTVHVGKGEDPAVTEKVLCSLEKTAGRVIVNGYPTGVEVGDAMFHGGPYPATTDPGATSVGAAAIRRFVRPLAYQNTPQELLPPALRDDNPLGIVRLVDGRRTDGRIGSASR